MIVSLSYISSSIYIYPCSINMSPKLQLEQIPIVRLPTISVPSHIQLVVGKRSAISDDIEDFRGIPYAHVPGRWEHARLRYRLPRDTFDATENG